MHTAVPVSSTGLKSQNMINPGKALILSRELDLFATQNLTGRLFPQQENLVKFDSRSSDMEIFCSEILAARFITYTVCHICCRFLMKDESPQSQRCTNKLIKKMRCPKNNFVSTIQKCQGQLHLKTICPDTIFFFHFGNHC